MLFESAKKKIAKFINSVVELRFQEILEHEEQEQKRVSEVMRQVQELEEKVEKVNIHLMMLDKNINKYEGLFDMLRDVNQRIEALEENVQENYVQLDLMDDTNRRLQILEENVRNNNIQINFVEDASNRLQVLEKGVQENKSKLDLLKDTNQRLQTLEENIRNNNNTLSTALKENYGSFLEAKIEALKNSIGRLQEGRNETIEDSNIVFQNKSNDAYYELDYFSFENHFRGDEKLIRERQKIYLPYFQDCSSVLDLGCGRGEFLELLRESGIKAIGVDFYEEFAIYDRNKGLDVVTGDAISYLEGLPNKVDGIFAGQLVEHLTVEQIIALCRLAFDKLEKGKYFIMETPNPMSLAIYTHAFYIDPSHQKPVHPLTLKYFAEKAGFNDVQIIFPEASKLDEDIPLLKGDNIVNLDEFNASMKRVSDYLYGSQDYAVIARR